MSSVSSESSAEEVRPKKDKKEKKTKKAVVQVEEEEQVEEQGSQLLIISHHPELINYYVPRDAVRFFRQHGGPVRVKPFTTAGTEALPPAEIVARGWEDE